MSDTISRLQTELLLSSLAREFGDSMPDGVEPYLRGKLFEVLQANQSRADRQFYSAVDAIGQTKKAPGCKGGRWG